MIILLASAYGELRRNGLRTVLSVLTVAVSVCTFTLVVAAGQISRSATDAFLEARFGQPATIKISSESSMPYEAVIDLTSRLKRLRVLAVPVLTYGDTLKAGNLQGRVQILGVTPELSRVRTIEMRAGRWLSAHDADGYAPSVVISPGAANLVGLSPRDAIGKVVSLGGDAPVSVKVVGVAADNMAADDNFAYANLASLQRWDVRPAGGSRPADGQVTVRVPVADVPALERRLSSAESPWITSGSLIVQRVDTTDEFFGLTSQQATVLKAIAVVSLVAGMLGILNQEIASIRERRREFGIRRTFGATGAHLAYLVLAEASIAALLGGLAGVALAIVVQHAAPTAITGPLPATVFVSFPLEAAGLGMALAWAVGLIAGLAPATVAARTSISAAVRR